MSKPSINTSSLNSSLSSQSSCSSSALFSMLDNQLTLGQSASSQPNNEAEINHTVNLHNRISYEPNESVDFRENDLAPLQVEHHSNKPFIILDDYGTDLAKQETSTNPVNKNELDTNVVINLNI